MQIEKLKITFKQNKKKLKDESHFKHSKIRGDEDTSFVIKK